MLAALGRIQLPVHPSVRVFCDGSLAAELGPRGHDAPITFTPSDGQSPNVVWLVADVRFVEDPCIGLRCEVKPLYEDPATFTPVRLTSDEAGQTFGPGYPP